MSRSKINKEVSAQEALKQSNIINELSINIKDKKLKYCVSTYGCQMNVLTCF